MSSQWNSVGYYYPTQIAQYGLSHYSKYIVERRRFEAAPPPASSKPFADDDDARLSMTDVRWRLLQTNGTNSVLRRVHDEATQRYVYHFRTPRESYVTARILLSNLDRFCENFVSFSP